MTPFGYFLVLFIVFFWTGYCTRSLIGLSERKRIQRLAKEILDSDALEYVDDDMKALKQLTTEQKDPR